MARWPSAGYAGLDMVRFLPLVLGAALASPPFPAPKLAPASENLKCDRATVVQVMAATSELIGMTAAGSVTYKIAGAQVLGPEGRPLGAGGLKPRQKIRVYYTLGDGAIASEVDLEP